MAAFASVMRPFSCRTTWLHEATDSWRKWAFRPAPLRARNLFAISRCLPCIVEIATALQAWQVGEIVVNAFHAQHQRGHGPQNAPARQGQQAQRTKQHGHRQHHCLCTNCSRFPATTGRRS